jgi:endonuclease YncB( thermonuclease family)
MNGTQTCRRWAGLALSLASFGSMADTLTGRVIWVTDGDTMAVQDEKYYLHWVRVAGIELLEKKMPFGQRAKDNLSHLVLEKKVAVDWHKHDRDQRIVGKVMVADPSCSTATCPKTVDAGMAQITVGLARWFGQDAYEQSAEDQGRYEFAEQDARDKRVGLWSDPNRMAP